MLTNSVFSLFEEERYSFLCTFLENPAREIQLEKDSYCRQSLERSYKCSHCHQLSKIARNLPLFRIESGNNEGREFHLEETSTLPLFYTSSFIFYDTFRGSYLISLLLERVGLPTLNYITCAYSCRKNRTLLEKFPPLSSFTLDQAKQLLLTLKLLEKYKFVLDEAEFSLESLGKETTISYEGMKVSSPFMLKINAWHGSSFSFNSSRLITGERIRRERLSHTLPSRKEEWFRPYSAWRDLKHLGDTRFNVYLCFLSLYPLLEEETKRLWKELWKEEERIEIEASLEKGENVNLDCFSLRNNGLDHLFSLCK